MGLVETNGTSVKVSKPGVVFGIGVIVRPLIRGRENMGWCSRGDGNSGVYAMKQVEWGAECGGRGCSTHAEDTLGQVLGEDTPAPGAAALAAAVEEERRGREREMGGGDGKLDKLNTAGLLPSLQLVRRRGGGGRERWEEVMGSSTNSTQRGCCPRCSW
jgi:hypothetical protein